MNCRTVSVSVIRAVTHRSVDIMNTINLSCALVFLSSVLVSSSPVPGSPLDLLFKDAPLLGPLAGLSLSKVDLVTSLVFRSGWRFSGDGWPGICREELHPQHHQHHL